MLYANPLLQKTFNLIWINFNYLIAEGSSGSNGLARVKRERTYSWEPLLCYEKYFLIYVICKVNTEVQHETKIYEHWQDPMERARVNNFNQWRGWCHKIWLFYHTIPIAVALKLNCGDFCNSNSCWVLPLYRNFCIKKSMSTNSYTLQGCCT